MPRTKETFEAMRETTRQKIEAAALSLIARKGISVTIGEIAQAAGLSKGLLYSHFQSKEALIAELVRQATVASGQNIMNFCQSNNTSVSKVKKITAMMRNMFSKVPIEIDYFMFMIQVEMSGFKVPEMAQYSEELPSPVESLASIIEQGQLEGSVIIGDTFQLSFLYWAAFQGLCCYAITGRPVCPDPQVLNRILLKEEFI